MTLPRFGAALWLPLLAAALAAPLQGCGPGDDSAPVVMSEQKRSGDPYKTIKESRGSVFGEDGATLFGGSEGGERGGPGPGIGVNSFLWRASLDTISFMPLASADPFGGVIITDWYTPSDVDGERFKINLYILGRQLRADGVQAAVFRQVRRDGTWVDAEVDEQTAIDLENAILTRARQMRIAGLQ